MAFRLPTFNLLCNLWNATPLPPVPAPRLTNVPCQLAWDHSTIVPDGGTTHHFALIRMPIGTDVRGRLSTTGPDVVECPAGSGRYYLAIHVDDVAKGFPNEYRVAMSIFGRFPTPLP